MHRELPNVEIGQKFENRQACYDAEVHRHIQAGIAGYAGGKPAESIVISGGYEDDRDHGDVIIYTGDRGRDPNTGKIIQDQELEYGNAGLYRNWATGTPVRVVRSIGKNDRGKPYQYDGLYEITREPSYEIGVDGFYIYRFRLESISGIPPKTDTQLPLGSTEPKRELFLTDRIVRSTAVANSVKNLHDHTCQVCGVQISTPQGNYAEAAHIQPLGRPHNGPDVTENVLCLCANCHVKFDRGAIGVADDFTLINADGKLRQVKGHAISTEYLAHHRRRYKLDAV